MDSLMTTGEYLTIAVIVTVLLIIGLVLTIKEFKEAKASYK